jgi:hypothetical protein
MNLEYVNKKVMRARVKASEAKNQLWRFQIWQSVDFRNFDPYTEAKLLTAFALGQQTIAWWEAHVVYLHVMEALDVKVLADMVSDYADMTISDWRAFCRKWKNTYEEGHITGAVGASRLRRWWNDDSDSE